MTAATAWRRISRPRSGGEAASPIAKIGITPSNRRPPNPALPHQSWMRALK